jgi:peptidoglycan hydrolase-like protein with peptidoglycan-binding domain
MRRLTVLATLLAASALAPVTALPAQAATAAAQAQTATGACQRTLASYPVLRPGARRPAVRTLQCVLNDGGWGPVVVDGFYGPQTRQAVARVEAGFEGPSPSPGRINNGFWVLLFGQQLPDRNLQLGQHGPAVRTLQRALRAAGATIVVDAQFGPQTRSVVKAYQRHNHFTATGVVNSNTRFMLAMGGVLGLQN